VAAGVSYVVSVLGFGLAAARKFDVQLLVYICATLVTAVACVPLVPRYSLLGAAWALLAGLLIMSAGFTLALSLALRPHRAGLAPLEADARS
jgi:O-antigen/teichoic acid export membrane protein